jgi:hypothetical protein
MDQWKGAPKPTTPANRPASGCCTAKPAQRQPDTSKNRVVEVILCE